MQRHIAALTAMLALTAPAAASAEVQTFRAALNGTTGTDPSGSRATGTATVHIDMATRRVSVDMAIEGLTIASLWDNLVTAPIGPIHFHKYADAAGGTAALALPVPFGPGYRETPTGMQVTIADYDYAGGAALLGSTLAFEDFVAAMRSGLVILNVHTDAFNAGEIGGAVVPG